MAAGNWIAAVLIFWSAVGFALADDNPARAQRPLADQYAALLMNGRSLEDVKLAVDHWVDPTADETNVKLEIDRLHASLKPMLAGVPDDHGKLKILRRFLYEAGQWNGNRPFSYEHSDPTGSKPGSKLLARYLETGLATVSPCRCW